MNLLKARRCPRNADQSLIHVRLPQRLLLSIATVMTVSSCGAKAPDQPPPPVQAAMAEMAEFTDAVDTVSTLESTNRVNLAAQSGGRILELKISQDVAAPGQLMVVLDQVEKKAKADTAKTNYERYRYLFEAGAASQMQLDRYRTEYIMTQVELDYTNLTSPSAGTVADVDVQVGDVIQQGQVFTSLTQNAELEARVSPAVFASHHRSAGDPQRSGSGGYRQGARLHRPPRHRQHPRAAGEGAVPQCRWHLRDGQRLRTRVLLEGSRAFGSFAAVTQTSGQSFVFRLGSFEGLRANPGKADLEGWRRPCRRASCLHRRCLPCRPQSPSGSWRTVAIRSPKGSNRTNGWPPPTC